MGELLRGGKIGAISGASIGYLISMILSPFFIVYDASRSGLLGYISMMGTPLVIFASLVGAVIGALLGVICGLVFAAAYDHLPGTKSLAKGTALGLIIGVMLALPVFIIFSSPGNSSIIGAFVLSAPIGIGSLIWGFMVGETW